MSMPTWHRMAHASPALKKDLQIVSAAVLECEAPGDPEYPLFTALNWASDGIRNDKDFVSTAIAKNPFCYAGASEALRGDPEIILLAAGAKPELLSSFQGYGERLDWPIPQSAIARGKIHDWVTEQLTTRSKFVDVFLLGTRGPDRRSSSAVGLASRIRTVQKAKVGGGGGKTSAQVRDLLAPAVQGHASDLGPHAGVSGHVPVGVRDHLLVVEARAALGRLLQTLRIPAGATA